MFQLILEGILFGLTLTILLGPIFIALTQTAMEKGTKAGLMVGLGVWTSDFIIITICYIFIKSLIEVFDSTSFKLYLGLFGGCVLMIFGLSAFLKKMEFNYEKQSFSALNLLGFWFKGFAVNTFNPFTFIFWIGVLSTYVIGRSLSLQEAFVFIGSIMLTIIVTDSAKVILAKFIRGKLSPQYIQYFTKIAGIGLFIFGVLLIVKSI